MEMLVNYAGPYGALPSARYKVARILHNLAKVDSNRAQMLEERASMTISELFRFRKPPGMHQALTNAVDQFARWLHPHGFHQKVNFKD